MIEPDNEPGTPAGSDAWRYPNRATPPGSSLYYAVRFAPRPLRDLLAALAGWRQQVHAVLDEVSDPGVARLKLDWWRDEIRRTLDGAPRHPLSHLLAAELARRPGPPRLPADAFLAIAERVEHELRRLRPADDAALAAADRQDMGALFALMARSHGLHDDAVLAAAVATGTWCAQVRRLRDAGLLLRRHRTVLPTATLQRAGLSHEALASAAQRHRLAELLTPVAERLQANAPRAALNTLPRALRIQQAIHTALLDELLRSKLAVADQRIGLTPLRKLGIAFLTR
ncbi:MAG: squalene/phytoene synthase family protein [Thiohalocapsa sp.]|jgi:phytoene synthase|uniref:squalene/phytoene synthase family protein n=1 Tax=Thiohalocapsa sp. TaxID=2497641 RepID=UPI0025FE4221|nr:squalene/phytoene synthase family protein [Thiohalocapsa sp.]MCG6941438.1 squalene/phytoene synthase family protein [Thiohalocapsa sp.]